MTSDHDDELLDQLLSDESRDLCEKDLRHFILNAWDILEPGRDILWNWHIEAIAEHLEAVAKRQIKKLIINMPPRYGKSICATVCYPVWCWIKHPEKRFFCASYASSLSEKHSLDRRMLIQSPWFQANWGDRFKLQDDQNRVKKFSNTKRGHMIATSVGGGGTGEGGDDIIIDDPINPEMAESDVERATANRWHDTTVSTRKDDKKNSGEVIIMQRLHEDDLTGHVLEKQPDKWTVLELQGKAESTTSIFLPISKIGLQYNEGSFLHPEREGDEEHAERKLELGDVGYAAQYQQRPRAGDSAMVKREYWRFYKELPKDIFRIRQYWDTAEEPGLSNDFSVCATIAEAPSGYYWLDMWQQRVKFPQLEAACKNMYAKEWNRLDIEKVKIEKKASGTQLLQNLSQNTTMPLEAFEPGQRNKKVRLAGVLPTINAGNCYLPEGAPWVEDFIDQHERFPFAKHDDMVDTTSMGLEDLRQKEIMPRIRSL